MPAFFPFALCFAFSQRLSPEHFAADIICDPAKPACPSKLRARRPDATVRFQRLRPNRRLEIESLMFDAGWHSEPQGAEEAVENRVEG
jgi:hypothetical protein